VSPAVPLPLGKLPNMSSDCEHSSSRSGSTQAARPGGLHAW
jgi:hypothetical protein